MTISLSSPVTGGAQTGFTSPTYTVTTDTAPDSNGKQWAVTALGGTQTGVDTHLISKPFTITFTRPASFRSLGAVNPVTGAIASIPRNIWKIITRKGVVPLVNQPAVTLMIKTFIEVPAGSDSYEPEDIRAALALHIGALNQVSAGLGDSLISGVI